MALGGPLVGLLDGMVRKRGFVGTTINIVVATVFAFGMLALEWHFVRGKIGADIALARTLFVLLALAPTLSAMVGVWLVLKLARRERWPTFREIGLIVGLFPIAFLLSLISLTVSGQLLHDLFALARKF